MTLVIDGQAVLLPLEVAVMVIALVDHREAIRKKRCVEVRFYHGTKEHTERHPWPADMPLEELYAVIQRNLVPRFGQILTLHITLDAPKGRERKKVLEVFRRIARNHDRALRMIDKLFPEENP